MITALLNHVWQSSLFALAVAFLTLLLKNNSAASRHALWLAASLKFLLPFSLLSALGRSFTPQLLPHDAVLPVDLGVAAPAVLPFHAVLLTPATPAPFDPLPFLLLAWSVGFAAVVATWLLRWRRIAAAARASRPLALPAPMPVRESNCRLEPGLVGIFRPVLLLPAGIAARLSPAEMKAVIAHEQCHMRRHDNLTALVHMLVQALFWFHPLVWWIGRKLVDERERACDEAALAAGNDPGVFAEAILRVCKFYLPSPLTCAAGVSGADLRTRLMTILANRQADRLGLGKKLLLGACAVASLTLPVLAGLPNDEIERRAMEQKQARTAIALPPATFDKFVGDYQSDTFISITREGGHFFASRNLGADASRPTPHGRQEILPDSPSSFFAKDVPAQYSFEADAQGRVTGLVFHQSGLARHFRRIDEGTAAATRARLAARIQAGLPSHGTNEALVRYIRALSAGALGTDVSAGIRAKAHLGSPRGSPRVKALGAIQSIAFQDVGPDGMDRYEVTFAQGRTVWWIAPLAADGRIVWVGFSTDPPAG